KVWYAECELKIPGKNSVRSTSTNYDLGIALEEVKDDISRLLRNEKDKQETKTRRKKTIKGDYNAKRYTEHSARY
ncbi:hypothetical protein KKH63_02715, partial [Patescibacteria group bacterium]|nr:hypothetical protein [Patescibacteria group bacterium]